MSKKIVVIGSGNISSSHIEAAKANGFQLFGICGSENSQSALNLATKYEFSNYFPSFEKLLEQEFDSAAIVCNTVNLSQIYDRLSKRNIPILVEKPFSVYPEKFSNEMLRDEKLIIGYNRRHYSSIQKLKNKLFLEPFYHAIIEISELSWVTILNKTNQVETVLENSVHLLDLLFYLFGDHQSCEVEYNVLNGELKAINSKLKYLDGATVDLKISFGVPLNSSISVRFKDSIVECKPIEFFSLYQGMEMLPPDSQIKFKRYKPILSNEWELSELDKNYKPGFFLQYEELSSLVTGSPARISAKPSDALKTLRFARELIEKFIDVY
jgi:predicted dehydrogenase